MVDMLGKISLDFLPNDCLIYREDWDILWVERDAIYEILNNFHLSPVQRINHYRNHFELTRKDLMVKNLKRYKKQIEKEGRFDEAAQ